MLKFFLLFALLVTLHAKEYKVVFDCSSGDIGYLKSRMWLIGKTVDMFKQDGDTLKAVLTMHGQCAKLASADVEIYVKESEKRKALAAQEYLQELVQSGKIKAYVCAMSLEAGGIDAESILPNITISKNSYMETIKYQNEGYAIMTFK